MADGRTSAPDASDHVRWTGSAAPTRHDGRGESSDPVTGEPITVSSTKGHLVWEPVTTVVYVGQRSCPGPAADITCGALNFFTSRATAHEWSTQHPDFTGSVIDQARAEALGQAIFGSLLTEPDA